jgi:hypothetical protein
MMTELLRDLFSQLEQLPDDQQDAIASRLLTELNDDLRWEKNFEKTSETQWEKMAITVRQEILMGETIPLNEIFSA